MNIDERLEVIGQRLDMLTKIHLDNDREYRERMDQIAAAAAAATAAAEARREAAEARREAADARREVADARREKEREKAERRFEQRMLKLSAAQDRLTGSQEQLTKAQERTTRDIRALAMVVQEDGEHIGALARVAKVHEKRLDRLDAR